MREPATSSGAGVKKMSVVKMVREKLTALALAALLLPGAQGGEIKAHRWPSKFLVQEIPGSEIPVVMDVMPIRTCRLRGRPIKLRPSGTEAGRFEGYGDLLVQCNVTVTLSCSIAPTGVVEGKYSASLSESKVDAPGGTVRLFVTLTDAVPGGKAGSRNVRVATVTIRLSVR